MTFHRSQRRASFFAGCMIVLLALPASAHQEIPQDAPAQPILLRGGTLHTISEGVLFETDLLIADGVIRAMGHDLPATDEMTIIDIRGLNVYPGLIAPYTGLGLIEIGAVRATRDARETGPLTPETMARSAFNPDSEIIPTVRSLGITTALIVPRGGLISGRSFLAHLDGWTRESASVRDIAGLHVEWPATWARTKQRPVDGKGEDKQEKARSQRTKLEEWFTRARAYHLAQTLDTETSFDLRLDAIGAAIRGEVPVFIHAEDRRQILEAIDFAERHELRMVLVGARDAVEILPLLRERAIPVIYGPVTRTPHRADLPDEMVFEAPGILDRGGITLAIGTLSGNGWSTRNLAVQAAQAVAHGLSRQRALRALTLGPAEIFGVDDRLGSLAPGKQATIFVAKGDPLDLRGFEVEHMFIEGRPVSLDDRHKRLYRKYREKLRQWNSGTQAAHPTSPSAPETAPAVREAGTR